MIAAGGTGGHMFPARAFAEEMQARGWRVGLVSDERGLKYASDFPASWKAEIAAASLSIRRPFSVPGSAMKITAGIRQARRLLDTHRPALVAGFGGYPAFPSLTAARRRGIPILIHEQNAVLGRVNRHFAKQARLVASGFERLDFLPSGSAHLPLGNPVRAPIRDLFHLPYPPASGELSLLVTGGSQGARIIGETVPLAIANFLPEDLRSRLTVVQQVRIEQTEIVRSIYRKAGVRAQIAPFFNNMAEHLAAAHLVIARAGAGTVSEIAMAGRPSILLPLAIAMDDHQAANAEALTEAGAADMILESNLSPRLLGELLKVRLTDPGDLAARAAMARSVARPDAARDLAEMAGRIAEL